MSLRSPWGLVTVGVLAIATIACAVLFPQSISDRRACVGPEADSPLGIVETHPVCDQLAAVDWTGRFRATYRVGQFVTKGPWCFTGREFVAFRRYEGLFFQSLSGGTIAKSGNDDCRLPARDVIGVKGDWIVMGERFSDLQDFFSVAVIRSNQGEPLQLAYSSGPLPGIAPISSSYDLATDTERYRLSEKGQLEVVETTTRRARFSAAGTRVEERADGRIDVIEPDKPNTHTIASRFADVHCLSPSGDRIALKLDAGWRVLQWRTGREVTLPVGSCETHDQFVFSPDGTRGVTVDSGSGWDWAIWDLDTGRPVVDHRTYRTYCRMGRVLGFAAIAWIVVGVVFAIRAPDYPTAATWLSIASGIGAATLMMVIRKTAATVNESRVWEDLLLTHLATAFVVVACQAAMFRLTTMTRMLVLVGACATVAWSMPPTANDQRTGDSLSGFANAWWAIHFAMIGALAPRCFGYRVARNEPQGESIDPWRFSIVDLLAITWWAASSALAYRHAVRTLGCVDLLPGSEAIGGLLALIVTAPVFFSNREITATIVPIALFALILPAISSEKISWLGDALPDLAIVLTTLLFPTWLARRHGYRWRRTRREEVLRSIDSTSQR